MSAAIRQLQQDLSLNPSLLTKFQQDPQVALKDYQQSKNPKEWDAWIYRIVVIALGLTVLVIVLGVLVIMFQNLEIKNQNLITLITSIGSAALGALAGLLAPSPVAPENT